MRVIAKAQDGNISVKKKPLFFYMTLIWRLKSGVIEVVEGFRTD